MSCQSTAERKTLFKLSNCLSSSRGDAPQLRSHGVISEYAFYLTSGGLLQSLPAPVPRKNQKLVKPEWFDILRRMKDAEQQIDGCRGSGYFWGTAGSDGSSLRQSQAVIATEFPSVIRLKGLVPDGKFISMGSLKG